MQTELQKSLKIVFSTLEEKEKFEHASRLIGFDEQTICPPKAMENQGKTIAFLTNQAFKLTKSPEFISAAENLFARREELNLPECLLAEGLHRDYLQSKNITSELDEKFSLILNQAFVDWLNAKNKADFSLFADSLEKVRWVNLKQIELSENSFATPYDHLLQVYERGITTQDLDFCFDACKERLIPLLKKIQKSPRKISADFLTEFAAVDAQEKLAKKLLQKIGFDFSRGTFSTSEHPFTDGIALDDARLTTNYDEHLLMSNIFSILHEGGHALFEQNQPAEDFVYHLTGFKTLGQHESVSRFYENRIGRSREFCSQLFEELKISFPQIFANRTAEELYDAVNLVTPSLIRIEADEFTYTFHIIIRYEMEKMIVNENVKIQDLLKIWADKYEEYLDIRPENDREGILQDVHWASGFGYFPTYALGNMYGAMYFNKMQEEFDVHEAIAQSDLKKINHWMQENVWKSANRLAPKEWIKNITGREFTPQDFLDYLEKKYSEIYGV
ncbi:carboxypeptidase M32 [Hallerella porci]|uniref:Metal-dependent carboxypeptidase n=1 Tax=Hallerella porci TaxID=1945871 RepID=A0ABX5LKY5_9BACT|nr:carboxypeptidase M32 [Hallerella porci]PWL01918.1 carboxypeptidase Taq [Hallerella porci]